MNIVIEEKPESEDISQVNTSIDEELSYMDTSIAQQIDFNLNFTLPMLQHICAFYEIDYKRVKKQFLISKLVEFEMDVTNIEIVQERKRLWFYMQELKNNKYLSKYIISM